MSFPFALVIAGFEGSGRKAAVNHALKQLATTYSVMGKDRFTWGKDETDSKE